MRQEVTFINMNVCQGGERPEICLLPHRLVRVVRKCADVCRVVVDAVDRVPRQKESAKLGEIEPFIVRIPEASVIEVESVDVDAGCQCRGPKMQKPPFGGFAPCAEATGGIVILQYHRIRRSVPFFIVLHRRSYGPCILTGFLCRW